MLAEKYLSAKHRAVNTLEQHQDQFELPASHQIVFNCLFYLNIALPLMYGLAYIFNWQYYFQNNKFSSIIETITTIYLLLMNALLIISGAILVITVYSIRRFYKQKNAMDALDTGALVRHASTFALFLLAVFVESISYAIC
jgi:hypothetical protein